MRAIFGSLCVASKLLHNVWVSGDVSEWVDTLVGEWVDGWVVVVVWCVCGGLMEGWGVR